MPTLVIPPKDKLSFAPLPTPQGCQTAKDPANGCEGDNSELETRLRIIWQEFQDVVRTMRWDETAAGNGDEKLGEIEDDICEIREVIGNEDV